MNFITKSADEHFWHGICYFACKAPVIHWLPEEQMIIISMALVDKRTEIIFYMFMVNTFEKIIQLPKKPVHADAILDTAFVEIYEGIRALRDEFGLRMTNIAAKDIHLIDQNDWDGVMKREKRKNRAVGYYIPRECFVRYESGCQVASDPMLQQGAYAECADTMAHEMLHHASEGGLDFSTKLNEGITTWLSRATPINEAIKKVVGKSTDSQYYPCEVEMWKAMRKAEPKASRLLLSCYWEANQLRAQNLLEHRFSPGIAQAVASTQKSASAVLRLLAKHS